MEQGARSSARAESPAGPDATEVYDTVDGVELRTDLGFLPGTTSRRRLGRRNAARLGVDPDRSALVGSSRGEQLALLAEYAPRQFPPSCDMAPVRPSASATPACDTAT